MKKITISFLFIVLFVVQATAQKSADEATLPVNYFTLPFETQFNFSGKLNDEIPYWIGFDKKKDFEINDAQKVLQQAVLHIAALKDSLQNPYSQKKLRIVLFPDGKTATFHLKEKDNGKELTFYNGTYLPLKTDFDTLEIVQRKVFNKEEAYVLYTFSLKNINDLKNRIDELSFQDFENKLAKNINSQSAFFNNLFTDVYFGAAVNTYIPTGIYIGVGYYYALQRSEVGKFIIGLHFSSLAGVRKDTLMSLTNLGIEIGTAKMGNGKILQKATLELGLQLKGSMNKTDKKPLFYLGFNLPISNNLATGLFVATDFKTNYTDPNRKTNLGVVFTYHF